MKKFTVFFERGKFTTVSAMSVEDVLRCFEKPEYITCNGVCVYKR